LATKDKKNCISENVVNSFQGFLYFFFYKVVLKIHFVQKSASAKCDHHKMKVRTRVRSQLCRRARCVRATQKTLSSLCRAVGTGDWGRGLEGNRPSQVLADQLTLFQPGEGQIIPITLLLALRIFSIFLCTAKLL
jgi:hypothetical protein